MLKGIKDYLVIQHVSRYSSLAVYYATTLSLSAGNIAAVTPTFAQIGPQFLHAYSTVAPCVACQQDDLKLIQIFMSTIKFAT